MPVLSRLVVLVLVSLSATVAGCGGGGHHPSKATLAVAKACPPNRATSGCSLKQPERNLTAPLTSVPSGGLFPDVSVWQGAVNWPAVKAWQQSHRWTPAAIFKLGEYTLDSQAPRNAAETARLGFWRAGYWFVRNTGCAHEAGLIVWAARRYGLHIIALDIEVPEAAGYDACLTPPLKAAGLIVVTYTAPGTWPGGSSAANPAWEATYGPRLGCLVWTCRPVAWQFTDGLHGATVFVPGVGRDDVSVDLGITRLGAPAPPPRIICFGRHAELSNSTCKRVRPLVSRWSRARNSSRQVLDWALGLEKNYACNTRHPRSNVCPQVERTVRTMRQRTGYFDRKAHSTFKEYT